MILLCLLAWAESPAIGVDPAALLGAPAHAPVADAELRERTHSAAKLLRCVVCQGLSVADSPSETARAMRDEVEALVAKGYDTEQVLMYFEASYGEFVLLEPKREGFTWAVWLLPVAVPLVGAAWILLGRRNAAPGVEMEDDPYLRRVREETRS